MKWTMYRKDGSMLESFDDKARKYQTKYYEEYYDSLQELLQNIVIQDNNNGIIKIQDCDFEAFKAKVEQSRIYV